MGKIGTDINMSMESVFYLDKMEDIIDSIRGFKTITYNHERMLEYLNSVNGAIMHQNLDLIRNEFRIKKSPEDEIQDHYKIAGFGLVLLEPTLGKEVPKKLIEGFEQAVYAKYQLRKPLSLKFLPASKKELDLEWGKLEKVASLDVGIVKMNLSDSRPAKAELFRELQELSRRLRNEDTYTRQDHLAFKSLNKFVRRLFGDFKGPDIFYDLDKTLREVYGVFVLRLPDEFD